jgi:hypothetical protein
VVTAPDIPGHRVGGVLGAGGFATVYRCWQLAVGREVAVKVDNRVLLTERDRRRFLREVTAAGRLSGHPHVIDVYDAGTLDDGRPYLVMELCPAGSLNDALRRHGPMPAAQVRDIGVRLADALAAAHASGVLHRDIKPANILVNRFGMVGLSDFGLASIISARGEQTASREALTPAYSSPETYRGEEPTVLADIYSLAATLYTLLAGRPPQFATDGRSPGFATIMTLHDKPVEDVPGTPPELMALLRAGLSPDPVARPQSAVALRDALADPRRYTAAAPTGFAARGADLGPADGGRGSDCAQGLLPGGDARVTAGPGAPCPGSGLGDRGPAAVGGRVRQRLARLPLPGPPDRAPAEHVAVPAVGRAVAQEQADRDRLAAAFRHRGVAGAYRYRLSYPAEVFDILERIITDRPRRVLDLGAGEGAILAIIEHGHRDLPWRAELTEVIARHSRSPGYDPALSLADALCAAGLLEVADRAATAPVLFRQPVAEYVEQFHSTASLARELMTAEEASAFDQAVTGLVRPYAADGVLDLPVTADLAWGRVTVTTGN